MRLAEKLVWKGLTLKHHWDVLACGKVHDITIKKTSSRGTPESHRLTCHAFNIEEKTEKYFEET
jgi:hypothetical protein